jgi:hypothetical protein
MYSSSEFIKQGDSVVVRETTYHPRSAIVDQKFVTLSPAVLEVARKLKAMEAWAFAKCNEIHPKATHIFHEGFTISNHRTDEEGPWVSITFILGYKINIIFSKLDTFENDWEDFCLDVDQFEDVFHTRDLSFAFDLDLFDDPMPYNAAHPAYEYKDL